MKKNNTSNIQTDILEAYPQRKQVTAFPERVFLKTNRFLTIFTVTNLSLIIALSCVFVYMSQRANVIVKTPKLNYIYAIDTMDKILKPAEGYHIKARAIDFALEDNLRNFIKEWHSVPYESDEIAKKTNTNTSLIAQMTIPAIYNIYSKSQENAAIETSRKKSIRDVHIYDFHRVIGNLWSAYIETFDLPISENDISTICPCQDNSKECITCKIKNNNKRERFKIWMRGVFTKLSAKNNPLGIRVINYNIGYIPIHTDPKDPLQEEQKIWDIPTALKPEI